MKTFISAAVLLDGLDKDNEDTDPGERPNGTASEKVQSARSGFEDLCGIGEDGDLLEERLRDAIRQDLSVLGYQIEGPHFKRWPAVQSTE